MSEGFRLAPRAIERSHYEAARLCLRRVRMWQQHETRIAKSAREDLDQYVIEEIIQAGEYRDMAREARRMGV